MFSWALDKLLVGFTNETHRSWRFQQLFFIMKSFGVKNLRY